MRRRREVGEIKGIGNGVEGEGFGTDGHMRDQGVMGTKYVGIFRCGVHRSCYDIRVCDILL